VSTHEENFPPIRQIRPLLLPGGAAELEYVVQAIENRYFNRRQKDALKTRLQQLLQGKVNVSIKGSGGELTIGGTPRDSADGRFTLLEALQQTLDPQAPFCALGVLLSSSFNVTDYVLGLQLLGTHEESALARVQNVLSEVGGVQRVSREPGHPDVFRLEVACDWRRAETRLLLELHNLGFGASLQIDTSR